MLKWLVILWNYNKSPICYRVKVSSLVILYYHNYKLITFKCFSVCLNKKHYKLYFFSVVSVFINWPCLDLFFSRISYGKVWPWHYLTWACPVSLHKACPDASVLSLSYIKPVLFAFGFVRNHILHQSLSKCTCIQLWQCCIHPHQKRLFFLIFLFNKYPFFLAYTLHASPFCVMVIKSLILILVKIVSKHTDLYTYECRYKTVLE